MKNSTKFVWIVLGAIAVVLVILTVIVRLMITDHLVVSDNGDNKRISSGPKITREYDIEDFSAIRVAGGWDVNVVSGSEYRVSAEFSEAAEEKLRIEKQGDTLYLVLDYKKNTYSSDFHGASVKITMPALDAVTVEGAVNLNMNGFSGSELDFRLDGAGQVGGKNCSYDQVNLKSSGAVNVDLKESRTRNADVDLEGAGNVMIRMNGGDLSGRLSGLARLEYSGDVGLMSVEKDGIASIEYVK